MFDKSFEIGKLLLIFVHNKLAVCSLPRLHHIPMKVAEISDSFIISQPSFWQSAEFVYTNATTKLAPDKVCPSLI